MMHVAPRWLSPARRTLAFAAVVALGALTACFGDQFSTRGVAGEAAIDLSGFRTRSQTSGDGSGDVRSARFIIYLVTGTTRREVASRLFTAAEIDAVDSDSTMKFTLTFPYTSVDDKFEVEGRGMSAQGDTLYTVGPVGFTMRSATAQGGQAAVAVTVPPVYVGPGATATTLTIAPRAATTSEGQSTTLTVTLADATGKALSSPTFSFHWWTNDGSIARVQDERVGVVTGGDRPGTTWVHVVFDPLSLTDSVQVTNTVPPSQLKVVNGSGQSAPAGATLPNPVTVQVLTSSGQPVAGVSVGFAVTSGGGSVSAASRVTASDGMASVIWTLGAAIGTQQVTASVSGLPSVVVSATAIQTVPTSGRSSVSVLPTAIQVGGEEAVVTAILRDANGAPMPGVAVTFSGPSWAVFNPTQATSDASGGVMTRVRATVANAITITVMASGQTIGSVSLAVGARQGVPASISIVSGNNQTVKIGQNFPQPLVIAVFDATGHPVAGASVDWGTAVGDGRLITDANGQSSAQYALPLGWPTGAGTVSVSVTGFQLVATFTYTAVP